MPAINAINGWSIIWILLLMAHRVRYWGTSKCQLAG
jgi:hypothetical protein